MKFPLLFKVSEMERILREIDVLLKEKPEHCLINVQADRLRLWKRLIIEAMEKESEHDMIDAIHTAFQGRGLICRISWDYLTDTITVIVASEKDDLTNKYVGPVCSDGDRIVFTCTGFRDLPPVEVIIP